MDGVRNVEPVVFICGIIAADAGVLDEAVNVLEAEFGAIRSCSEVYSFDTTGYYAAEMGEELVRRFVHFRDCIDPGTLAGIKLRTNELERRFATRSDAGKIRRRVNLDPGYVTPAKLVLATTKDFAHRICLRDGIYAEVTLNFGKEGVRSNEWTYPDFKSGRYDEFLLAVRQQALELGAESGK